MHSRGYCFKNRLFTHKFVANSKRSLYKKKRLGRDWYQNIYYPYYENIIAHINLLIGCLKE